MSHPQSVVDTENDLPKRKKDQRCNVDDLALILEKLPSLEKLADKKNEKDPEHVRDPTKLEMDRKHLPEADTADFIDTTNSKSEKTQASTLTATSSPPTQAQNPSEDKQKFARKWWNLGTNWRWILGIYVFFVLVSIFGPEAADESKTGVVVHVDTKWEIERWMEEMLRREREKRALEGGGCTWCQVVSMGVLLFFAAARVLGR